MNRITTLLVLATCSCSALGADVERAWVDPNATWMIHLNFEELKGSQLFQGIVANAGVDLHELEQQFKVEIHEQLAEEKDIPPHVLEMWKNIDFSVLDDLKSVTLFGMDGDDEPSAVILQTSDVVDQIVATLEPIEGVSVAPGDSMSFVALREPGEGAGGDNDHVAAIRKNPLTNDRTIVIADTVDNLVSELTLFAKQSAAGNQGGPSWASARPGSFLVVHMSREGLEHMDEDVSRILGQAQQVHLEAGESGGEVFADALLQTENADTANNIVAVATGLMAAGRLGLGGQPGGSQLIQMLNATRVSAESETMRASFRMPASKLVETIHSLEGLNTDDEHEVNIHIDLGDE